MPMLNLNCVICKKLYLGRIFPSLVSKYCSRVCFGVGSRNIPKGMRCKTCGKIFYITTSQPKRKYCSVKCIRSPFNIAEYSKSKKGTGFWATATKDEKWKRIKSSFERLVIKNENCWEWKNATDGNGYGRIYLGSRRALLAHRVSYLIHKGEIPDGLFVCHSCDNPTCTNPLHLFLGTPKDNMQDCIKKGRKNVPRGANHYNVKLTIDQAIKIKELTKLKYTQIRLSKMFNVSPSTIQNIVDGKTWKNATASQTLL